MSDDRPPLFTKGGKGGPGRPKGSRNRLAESFLDVLTRDFGEHGEEAIRRARTEDPVSYMKVIAGVLPKELKVKHEVDDISDDDLAAYIAILERELAAGSQAGGAGAPEGGAGTASGGEPPDGVPPVH